MRVSLLVAALPLVSASSRGPPAERTKIDPNRRRPADLNLNGKDYDDSWQGLDSHPSWQGKDHDPSWDGPPPNPAWDGPRQKPSKATSALDKTSQPVATHIQATVSAPATASHQPEGTNLPDNSTDDEDICILDDDTPRQKPSSTTSALDKPSQPMATQIEPAVSAAATATPSFGVPPVSFITSTRAPIPSATEVPSDSNDPPYMATINKWLSNLKLRTLEYDPRLAKNALRCSTNSNGILDHITYPGTLGQVMAPGKEEEFDKVFVGGWLAEREDLFQNKTVWKNFTKGWSYLDEYGRPQTGHADILADQAKLEDGTPLKLTKIGCGWAGNEMWTMWTCDLS